MGSRLPQLAARPQMPWIVGLAAMVLLAPTLGWGLLQDDWVQAAWVRGLFRGTQGPPAAWDLFRLTALVPGDRASQLELGVLPWWTDAHARLAFLRPLTSLTHWLDYTAWPQRPALMHAENLLLYGALVAAIGVLARRLLGAGPGAAIATVAYAIDDAHVMPAGWIANRHALASALATALTLIAHDRARRDGWRPGAWLGPIALAVGLASGESAIGALAYLLAHALFLDPGSRHERLLALAPYGVVALLWALAYRALGGGTEALGFYVDPTREPVAFLAGLPLRVPELLGAQLLPSPSEIWSYGPPDVERIAALVLALILATMLAAASSLLRASAVARFAVTGMALSILPVCSTLASDRLLVLPGVGGAIAIGCIVSATDPDRSTRARRALAAVLLVSNLGLALLLVPARFVFVDAFLRQPYERAAATLPEASGRSLVVMCTPDPFWVYVGEAIQAARSGAPLPTRLRILGVVQRGGASVERRDARTLVITIDEGFVHDPGSTLFRDPVHALPVGTRVDLGDVVATVERTRDDGRASMVAFELTEPLESSDVVWATWSERGYVAVAPPAIGARIACGPTP